MIKFHREFHTLQLKTKNYKRMKYLIILFFCIAFGAISAQELAKFKVQIEEDRIDAPVSVSLDGINYNTDKGALVLYEQTSAGEKATTCGG